MAQNYVSKLEELRKKAGVKPQMGGLIVVATGAGDDGVVQPLKQAGLLDTAMGKKPVHEGETVINKGATADVIPYKGGIPAMRAMASGEEEEGYACGGKGIPMKGYALGGTDIPMAQAPVSPMLGSTAPVPDTSTKEALRQPSELQVSAPTPIAKPDSITNKSVRPIGGEPASSESVALSSTPTAAGVGSSTPAGGSADAGSTVANSIPTYGTSGTEQTVGGGGAVSPYAGQSSFTGLQASEPTGLSPTTTSSTTSVTSTGKQLNDKESALFKLYGYDPTLAEIGFANGTNPYYQQMVNGAMNAMGEQSRYDLLSLKGQIAGNPTLTSGQVNLANMQAIAQSEAQAGQTLSALGKTQADMMKSANENLLTIEQNKKTLEQNLQKTGYTDALALFSKLKAQGLSLAEIKANKDLQALVGQYVTSGDTVDNTIESTLNNVYLGTGVMEFQKNAASLIDQAFADRLTVDKALENKTLLNQVAWALGMKDSYGSLTADEQAKVKAYVTDQFSARKDHSKADFVDWAKNNLIDANISDSPTLQKDLEDFYADMLATGKVPWDKDLNGGKGGWVVDKATTPWSDPKKALGNYTTWDGTDLVYVTTKDANGVPTTVVSSKGADGKLTPYTPDGVASFAGKVLDAEWAKANKIDSLPNGVTNQQVSDIIKKLPASDLAKHLGSDGKFSEAEFADFVKSTLGNVWTGSGEPVGIDGIPKKGSKSFFDAMLADNFNKASVADFTKSLIDKSPMVTTGIPVILGSDINGKPTTDTKAYDTKGKFVYKDKYNVTHIVPYDDPVVQRIYAQMSYFAGDDPAMADRYLDSNEFEQLWGGGADFRLDEDGMITKDTSIAGTPTVSDKEYINSWETLQANEGIRRPNFTIPANATALSLSEATGFSPAITSAIIQATSRADSGAFNTVMLNAGEDISSRFSVGTTLLMPDGQKWALIGKEVDGTIMVYNPVTRKLQTVSPHATTIGGFNG